MKPYRFPAGLLLCLLLLLSACGPTEVTIRQGTMEAALRHAKEEKKWLVAVLQRPGCTPCDLLLRDMTGHPPFGREHGGALFYSFDIGRPEHHWLSEWLHETSSPVSVIFDGEGRFLTAVNGGNILRLQAVLSELRAGRMDSVHRYNHCNLGLTGAPYQAVMQAGIDGYLQGSGKGADAVKAALERSVGIQPYFFNTYLLARMEKARGDTAAARRYARQALTFTGTTDFRLYTARRSEMKYVLDEGFSVADEPYAAVEDSEIDLGLLGRSDSTAVTFRVRNTGKKPLLIQNVVVSCSCLQIDWPKSPILPGSEGDIRARYRVKSEGLFSQYAHVFSNASNGVVILGVKGRVE